MFRYKLRTLLILLAVVPPLLAVLWFSPHIQATVIATGVMMLAVLLAGLVASIVDPFWKKLLP
jgi:hypothetical protein